MLVELGCGAFACYVLFNLVLIGCVPVIHHLTIQVSVVDEETSAPVPGVALTWHQPSVKRGTPIGSVDEAGRLDLPLSLQGQPLWVYPVVGSFDLRPLTLEARADQYEPRVVQLASALPNHPYREGVARLTIRLQRTPQGPRREEGR